MSSHHPNPSIISTLQLIRSNGVGPVTFHKLMARYGDIDTVLKSIIHFKNKIELSDIKEINTEYLKLEKQGGAWVDFGHALYPELLSYIDDAPPALATIGNTDLLQRPMIGIVGARNASTNGRRLTQKIARELGQAGYVIVSGLARGIDTAAHEAALETGTIAVLANGVDVVYPPENRKLYDEIAKNGLLISENPMGTEPAAGFFPRRNRIISGLCRGVILIEAAMKSGSLITARFALDQGREVFAVPGSPLDPRAGGPNHLIKTGQAHLVENTDDILNILNDLNGLNIKNTAISFALDKVSQYDGIPDNEPQDDLFTAPLIQAKNPQPPAAIQNPVSLTDDMARDLVLNHLGASPCEIDNLVYATKLPTSKVLAILVELELIGQIQRVAGNQVTKII